MKNNTLSGSYYPKNPQIKHFFRIMRITLFRTGKLFLFDN